MHDLNTINRLNGEAFSKAVDNFRSQGRYVLACYDGLTLMSIETFSSPEDAAEALVRANESAGASERFRLLSPTGAWHGTQRDQSEDRAQPYTLEELAALGRSTTKPDVTLGDYINRVTAQEA
jgi:hypothetical protein